MSLAEAAERRQVPVYLATIVGAVLLGLAVPGPARGLEPAVEPVLALLLHATFLAVPFAELPRSLRDDRFVAAVMVLDFLVVPVVVGAARGRAGRARGAAGRPARAAGPVHRLRDRVRRDRRGPGRRLLAVAPLLMLAQLLLPVYLLLLLGPDLATVVQPGPFLRAFLVLLALPLSAAVATELLANRHRAARVVRVTTAALMVPLMAATLLTVVAFQVPDVVGELPVVDGLLSVFAAFAAVMAVLGALTARAFRLDRPVGRALAFSGATHNSLVVLPLSLAVPDAYSIAAVVVVSQTLVELVAEVVFVRVIPRLVRRAVPAAAGAPA